MTREQSEERSSLRLPARYVCASSAAEETFDGAQEVVVRKSFSETHLRRILYPPNRSLPVGRPPCDSGSMGAFLRWYFYICLALFLSTCDYFCSQVSIDATRSVFAAGASWAGLNDSFSSLSIPVPPLRNEDFPCNRGLGSDQALQRIESRGANHPSSEVGGAQMANHILLAFIALDVLFACCGGLLLATALVTRASIGSEHSPSTVTSHLLLDSCPLSAATINAIFVLLTFCLSIPAIFSSTHRFFLRLHGYAVALCAIFTLVLGLTIWFKTLKTRHNLSILWARQTPQIQSLLQSRFHCCGYQDAATPPFVPDSTCTDRLVAAHLQGCVGPFSRFANGYLDVVFTAVFGIVAVDVILLLAAACLLKDRSERERYRLIDAKVGLAAI